MSHEDRFPRPRLLLLEGSGRFKAAQMRHQQVQYHDLRLEGLSGLYRSPAVMYDKDVATHVAKQYAEEDAPVVMFCMAPSSRVERARLRVAESAHRIAEQKLRVAVLRWDGEDASAAVKLLDEMKVVHRVLVEQLVAEQARNAGD